MPQRYGNCLSINNETNSDFLVLWTSQTSKVVINFALSDFTPTTKPTTAIFNFLWLKKYTVLWLCYVSAVDKSCTTVCRRNVPNVSFLEYMYWKVTKEQLLWIAKTFYDLLGTKQVSQHIVDSRHIRLEAGTCWVYQTMPCFKG